MNSRGLGVIEIILLVAVVVGFLLAIQFVA